MLLANALKSFGKILREDEDAKDHKGRKLQENVKKLTFNVATAKSAKKSQQDFATAFSASTSGAVELCHQLSHAGQRLHGASICFTSVPSTPVKCGEEALPPN